MSFGDSLKKAVSVNKEKVISDNVDESTQLLQDGSFDALLEHEILDSSSMSEAELKEEINNEGA